LASRQEYQGLLDPLSLGQYRKIILRVSPYLSFDLCVQMMWPSKSITYSPIQSCDLSSQETVALEKHDAQSLPTRTRWTSNLKSRTVQIILALSTSLLIFLILLVLSLIGSKTQLYDCGHSPAEAVAKNCHFDMLAFAWVPIPCFDAEYALHLCHLSLDLPNKLAITG
jgi:hypothetical protein